MKNAKILICLATLFLLGAASGAGLSRSTQANPQKIPAWMETSWMEKRLHEDALRLNLTPEQKESFRTQYTELAAELRSIREETAKKVRESLQKRVPLLARELSPEQRDKFLKMNDERRLRWRRARE
jgi:hypothetical protein